ncbi:MAG: NAD(P)H-quinone oxidoreductase [Thermoanaerobaculia bacterium]
MKAILVPTPGGPEALVCGEAPEPVLREGEVLVHVRATAVNRADLHQAAGKYPPPPGESGILGLEAAGVVEGTDERVFFLLPGGGYAEKVGVPRGMLMSIPPGLSFEEAAAIPEAWFTAYLNLFREGGLAAGEVVLVHAAASGVGTAAIQLAKGAGATVVATIRSAAKAEPLAALGADLVVDTTSRDFAEAVEERFGANAVGLVLDPVGGATLARNVRVMARCGRLVLIATMGGGTAELDLRALLTKRLRLVGSTLRARALAEKVDLTAAFVRDILPGFSDGRFRPLVDAVFPLARAGDAHRRMAANENVGKIVLTVGA